jgi:DHA2 family multidrug resistance protein
MFQAVGLPFLFVPITNVAYVGLSPTENNQASALMNVARNLGGTFGISLTQTLLAQRQQFHQARLTEHLQQLNPMFQQSVRSAGQTLVAHGMPAGSAQQAAVGQIYRGVLKQASMQSYIDAFHLLMIVVFCALPLILLMRRPDKIGGGAGGAA